MSEENRFNKRKIAGFIILGIAIIAIIAGFIILGISMGVIVSWNIE